MATIPETTHEHKIGICPACQCGIWADVDVAVKTGKPTVTVEGKPQVSVTAKIVALRVQHSCRDGVSA